MTKPKDLRRVVAAYERTKRLEAELTKERQALRDEITWAHDEGVTYQRIGDALGITRERVRQLIN